MGSTDGEPEGMQTRRREEAGIPAFKLGGGEALPETTRPLHPPRKAFPAPPGCAAPLVQSSGSHLGAHTSVPFPCSPPAAGTRPGSLRAVLAHGA